MSLLNDYSPSSASEITMILDDEGAKINNAIEPAKLVLTEDISHEHMTAATLVNPSTGGSNSSKNHHRNTWIIVSN
jgi:hypothetical protein